MTSTLRPDEPATWYPAGTPGVAVHWLELPQGERVRVVAAGPADAGAPAVVLLHGWGCNAFHFRFLLPRLAAHGVRAYAPDLRGHGLSHKPVQRAAYTGAALTEFTRCVLDGLDLQRAALLGHSLGAAIALDVALAHPDRVTSLTLLNPVGFTRLAGLAFVRRLPLPLVERAPHGTSRLVARAALHSSYGRIVRPGASDLEQYLYPALQPGGRYGIFAYASAYAWEPRPAEALAGIRAPTTVLLGERDRAIRAAAAIRHLGAIPGVQHSTVPGAGHVLAEEVPDYVTEALLRQLALPNDATRAPGATR